MNRTWGVALLLLQFGIAPSVVAQGCGTGDLAVQVLGSGGPDLRDGRASSSYLVWRHAKAIVLVDAGGGSALRFGQSGAEMSTLKVILFTHFHADHSSDLPALVLQSQVEGRVAQLPVFGPPGGDRFPSTTAFMASLFEQSGSPWRYLGSYGRAYPIRPHDVSVGQMPTAIFTVGDLTVDAVRVDHGSAPALAWRVDIGDKRIVFAGDTGGHGAGLVRLAEDADVLIAHNATSRSSDSKTIAALMPPIAIGRISARAHVKLLVLSHRMPETLGKSHEAQTSEDIRKNFRGPVAFANDLDCYEVR